jgi:hypothetical protein
MHPPLQRRLTRMLDIIHNLNDPIIVIIPNRRVTITRHLVIELRDRRGDGVRVQVTRRRRVREPDGVAVFEED